MILIKNVCVFNILNNKRLKYNYISKTRSDQSTKQLSQYHFDFNLVSAVKLSQVKRNHLYMLQNTIGSPQ